MATQTPTDAVAFLYFLADEVKGGGEGKSPEELLQTWRTTQADAIDDIRQSREDFESGRYRPFEEVDAEIRKKFGFAPRQ